VSRLLVSKYAPLYRQVQIYAGQGFTASAQLCRLVWAMAFVIMTAPLGLAG
jgi:hypothetical protein